MDMDEEKKKKLLALKAQSHAFSLTLWPIYVMLSWTWGDKVPTAPEIERRLNGLIDDVAIGNRVCAATGGLCVRYNKTFDAWEMLFKMRSDTLSLRKEMERGL